MKIGIDGRLIDQTGVGRYIKNLFYWLSKIDKKNQYFLFQPKIPWHSLKEQIFLPFWLIFQKVDLVHFPYFSFPILCPKKFILTIHDLTPWHFKTGRASTLPTWIYEIKHFFYKLILWIGVRRAIKIIAISQTTKNQIIRDLKIKSEKIVVIYEGVSKNFQFSIFNFQLNLRIKKLKPYFLYVGNAYPHKNLKRLIQAFSKINDKNLRLILVGPDDYFYKKIRQQVSKDDLDRRIIFWGSATDEELLVLYRETLALINPSLTEGFGLPGLEAMAVGCPVVCSDIETFREVYGRVPLYFDPQSIENIIRQIKRIINMTAEKRKKMIAAGKNWVKKYSWKECVKKTKEVYESCSCL